MGWNACWLWCAPPPRWSTTPGEDGRLPSAVLSATAASSDGGRCGSSRQRLSSRLRCADERERALRCPCSTNASHCTSLSTRCNVRSDSARPSTSPFGGATAAAATAAAGSAAAGPTAGAAADGVAGGGVVGGREGERRSRLARAASKARTAAHVSSMIRSSLAALSAASRSRAWRRRRSTDCGGGGGLRWSVSGRTPACRK